MADYVAYLRVSTREQGRSGLGLAAQRSTIEKFLGTEHRLTSEFVEVQSGKKDNRAELWRAIGAAKKAKASLIIARLDRFSRRVSFISSIMEQGVKLTVAEMPGATDFQLHIFAALAQEERRVISQRTKQALVEAKKRGTRLGVACQRLANANRQAATTFAQSLKEDIARSPNQSLAGIARHLNKMGHRTRSGQVFYPQTVKNIRRRLNLSLSEKNTDGTSNTTEYHPLETAIHE
ncbi:MAG: recombinase family protein [Alsobacter sp.]